jgi:biotin operon repressor
LSQTAKTRADYEALILSGLTNEFQTVQEIARRIGKSGVAVGTFIPGLHRRGLVEEGTRIVKYRRLSVWRVRTPGTANARPPEGSANAGGNKKALDY